MPQVVAVVGASRDRHKFGNKAVRAFRDAGHTVIPINPHETEVEGLRTYASVLDVPGPIDMATVYVQPGTIFGLFDEFERKKIPEIWLNPGADDDPVVDRARALGLNVVIACSIIGVGESPGAF